ncbi:MAG: metalloregulator ArsR/SmtB family transcription factor [Rhodospirillales bacterium]
MNERHAAAALAALGHEARLRVFRLLVKAGPGGLRVGEIGHLLAIPASTLKHHLGALVSAGLVEQERQGREVVNRAAFDTVHEVLDYVHEECCAGVIHPSEADTAA